MDVSLQVNRTYIYSEENIRLFELFIVYVYVGKDHRNTEINEAKCTWFSKSPDPELKDTVLSKDVLLEHIKRSALWREHLDNVVLPWAEHGAGNLILSCARSAFLYGNNKILKQPFKMLCQHEDVRQVIAQISNMDV